MQKSHIRVLLLAMVLTVSVFAGCTNSNTPSASQSSAAPSSAASVAPAAPSSSEPAPAAVDYPKGDINILIAGGPGGGNDLTTRALIPSLQETLKTNVVPLNKTEGGGAVAATEVATAKPDGQTLYFNSQSLILFKLNGMDIDLNNYQPVAAVVEDNGVIFVRADSPYNTISEYVDAAKTQIFNVGTNGAGAIWHLAAVQLTQTAGIPESKFVAYTSGGSAMLAALAGGEIDMCIVNPSEGKALVDAGKIKPIGTMALERLSVYPDAPTCKESGIDVHFPIWRGLFTAKGVSEDVLNMLDEAIKKATESDTFVQYCESNSLPISFKGHKEFEEIFQADIVKMTELAQAD